MQIFRSSNGAKRNLKSQNDMFNFSWTCRFLLYSSVFCQNMANEFY